MRQIRTIIESSEECVQSIKIQKVTWEAIILQEATKLPFRQYECLRAPLSEYGSGWTLPASPRHTSTAPTTPTTSAPPPPTAPARLSQKTSAGATFPVQGGEETFHVMLHNKGRINENPVSSWMEDAGLLTN